MSDSSFGSRFFAIASILGFLVDAAAVASWFIRVEPSTPSQPVSVPAISLPHADTVTLLILLYTFIAFLIFGVLNDHPVYVFVAFLTFPVFAGWAAIFAGLAKHAAIGLSLLWLNLYIAAALWKLELFFDEQEFVIPGRLQKSIFCSCLVTYPLVVVWIHGPAHPWLEAMWSGLIFAFLPFMIAYPPLLIFLIIIGVCYLKSKPS